MAPIRWFAGRPNNALDDQEAEVDAERPEPVASVENHEVEDAEETARSHLPSVDLVEGLPRNIEVDMRGGDILSGGRELWDSSD